MGSANKEYQQTSTGSTQEANRPHIGPKPKGAPPCPHRGVLWALLVPQGPHESTGGFLGPTGAFLRGRGSDSGLGADPKPAGCAFSGELKFWSRPLEKVMKKLTRSG